MYMGERVNGRYVIYPRGGHEITVYCDFTTNGGGWTVIQRRHKGDVPFPVDVGAYNNGFGSVDGEFWLGHKKINRLGDGQLLAVIYQNTSSFTYDLYSYFYVRISSELDVSGRTGIMDEGIFKSDGDAPLMFVAPKGMASPSSCLSKFDGGWWYGDTCEGSNLNAERKRCKEPFLSTEMLFRQRLPCKYLKL